MTDPRGWQRLRRHKVAVGCIVFLVLLAGVSIVVPEILPASYAEPSSEVFAPPSWRHPFGTDLNGRDVLYRVCLGGRISLTVGLAGAFVSLLIGSAYGLVAGYLGGAADAMMMRIVDVLYSVPRLIFILILINAFNEGMRNFAAEHGFAWLGTNSRIVILIISLGIIEWLTMARIVRGQALALKNREFVTAARALGQSHVRIIFRHILPNLLGVIIVYLTLTIPAVIIDESFLSFLGLGIEAPQASWGSLLADGASAINPVKSHWWLLLFPAVAMSLTLVALNFLGDALRDVFDPR